MTVLIDTSTWIDHLRRAEPLATSLLENGRVLVHPWMIGELAVGTYRNRASIHRDLSKLDGPVAASDVEVVRFIDDQKLFGTGIGDVDAALLASTKLTPDASLWTSDKRLAPAAERLGGAARLAH